MDRLTQARRAADTGVESQTNTQYLSPTATQTLQDQNAAADRHSQTQQYYDGLGRAIESRTFEDDAPFTAIDTTYDALGRVTQVTPPDGASSATSYAGNQTTVTDQAGKKRTMTFDALSRITQVVEDPGSGELNYTTTYGYDALDDLVSVSQGIQTRSSTYRCGRAADTGGECQFGDQL